MEQRVLTGLHVLRHRYCLKCKRQFRSTGVRLLEEYLKKSSIKCGKRLVIDYGCSNKRNSIYLKSNFGFNTVFIDILKESHPDVIAYPTLLPFKNNAADIILLTHILMFLKSFDEIDQALREAARIANIAVIECYHVKNPYALKYTTDELEHMIKKYFVIRRRYIKRNEHECYVALRRQSLHILASGLIT